MQSPRRIISMSTKKIINTHIATSAAFAVLSADLQLGEGGGGVEFKYHFRTVALIIITKRDEFEFYLGRELEAKYYRLDLV